MPEKLPADSVGLITPRSKTFREPLTLECGAAIRDYTLAYETYGELNSTHTNAILICHALSSHHHAAGYHSMEDKKPCWKPIKTWSRRMRDTMPF